ncbi:MAG: hypothetical protein N3E40_02535 [Dehalococcoidia bacterium]|nr:hypothetical protein [Dehalococcoidia bacterium]
MGGIQQYLDWWRRSYIEAYNHDLYIKGIAQQFIFTTAEDINYVFGMINETLPACFNAYSSPTRQAMAKIMPIIQENRPDIYQKLLRKNIPAKELLAPLTAISRPVQ